MDAADERRAGDLADRRQRYLGCIRILSAILIILGVVSMGVGAAAVLKTSPYYYFPFASGAGVAQGAFCLVLGLMGLCIVSEGRKTPVHRLANTTQCLRCTIGFSHCVGGFTLTAIMFGMGVSGAWAVAECNRDPTKAALSRDQLDRCLPDKQTNLALGGVIIALSAMLLICFLILWCTLICNSRSFGEKPRGYTYQAEIIEDLEAECNELREAAGGDADHRSRGAGRDHLSGGGRSRNYRDRSSRNDNRHMTPGDCNREKINELEAELNELREAERGDTDNISREAGADHLSGGGRSRNYRDRSPRNYNKNMTPGDCNRERINELEAELNELREAARGDTDNISREAGRDHLSGGGRSRDNRDRSPRGYNRDRNDGGRRRDRSPRDHHNREHGHYSNQNREDRRRASRGGERDGDRRRDRSPGDHHNCGTREHGHYSNQNRYGHGGGGYESNREDRRSGSHGGERDGEQTIRDRDRSPTQPSAPPDPSGDEKSALETDAPPSYSDVMSQHL